MNNPKGRPRNTAIDEAIVEVTWELLAEKGYDAMTFDEIISRVGCGRNSFYRRYSSKEALIESILQQIYRIDAPPPPADWSAREILIDYILNIIEYLSGPQGRATLNLMDVIARNPTLKSHKFHYQKIAHQAYKGHLLQLVPGKANYKDILFVMDSLIGAIQQHMLVNEAKLTTRQVELLADGTLHQLALICKPDSKTES